MTRFALTALVLVTTACSNNNAPYVPDTSGPELDVDADTEAGTDAPECTPTNHTLDTWNLSDVAVPQPCDTFTFELSVATGIQLTSSGTADLRLTGANGGDTAVFRSDGSGAAASLNVPAGTFTLSFEGDVSEVSSVAAWDVCALDDPMLVNGDVVRGEIGDAECLSRGLFDVYTFEVDTVSDTFIGLFAESGSAELYRGTQHVGSLATNATQLGGLTETLEPGLYQVHVYSDGIDSSYELELTMDDACPLRELGPGEQVSGHMSDTNCPSGVEFELTSTSMNVLTHTDSVATNVWVVSESSAYWLYTGAVHELYPSDILLRVRGTGAYRIATTELDCIANITLNGAMQDVDANAHGCDGLVRIPVWGVDGARGIHTYGNHVVSTTLTDSAGTPLASCSGDCRLPLESDDLFFLEVQTVHSDHLDVRVY